MIRKKQILQILKISTIVFLLSTLNSVIILYLYSEGYFKELHFKISESKKHCHIDYNAFLLVRKSDGTLHKKIIKMKQGLEEEFKKDSNNDFMEKLMSLGEKDINQKLELFKHNIKQLGRKDLFICWFNNLYNKKHLNVVHKNIYQAIRDSVNYLQNEVNQKAIIYIIKENEIYKYKIENDLSYDICGIIQSIDKGGVYSNTLQVTSFDIFYYIQKKLFNDKQLRENNFLVFERKPNNYKTSDASGVVNYDFSKIISRLKSTKEKDKNENNYTSECAELIRPLYASIITSYKCIFYKMYGNKSYKLDIYALIKLLNLYLYKLLDFNKETKKLTNINKMFSKMLEKIIIEKNIIMKKHKIPETFIKEMNENKILDQCINMLITFFCDVNGTETEEEPALIEEIEE